jgi:hypothetical protein
MILLRRGKAKLAEAAPPREIDDGGPADHRSRMSQGDSPAVSTAGAGEAGAALLSRRLPGFAATAGLAALGFLGSQVRPAEAAYTAGSGSTPDRVNRDLTVDGNVGIGTGAPAAVHPLHVMAAGGTAARFAFNGGDTTFIQLTESSGPRIDFGRSAGANLAFRGSTDGMTYDERLKLGSTGTVTMCLNGGSVGIGTNVPLAKLDVAGGIRANGSVLINGNLALDASGTAAKTFYAP